MRLFLVARHGQSLFNVDQVVNGDPALDRGLSEQGIEEAERPPAEPATLVVCHEIPVRYLANAAGGSGELNGPLRFVANATPYLFDETSLNRAVERIQELAG